MKRHSHAEFTNHLRESVQLLSLDQAIELHFRANPSLHVAPSPEVFRDFVVARHLTDEQAKQLLVQKAIQVYTTSANAPRTNAGKLALAYLQALSDAVVVGEPDPPGALVPITSVEPGPETKAERFRRLAPPRVSRALKAIALVANLGDRSNYESTAEEATAICRALDDEVRACKARLTTGRKPARSFDFKL
jgi:hypothetical protein